MNIPYVFKKCTKCGEWLVASTVNFHKKKAYKYGLSSMCKQCRLKKEKQYYLNDKEKVLKRKRKWYLNNKEKVLKHNKKYTQEHEERTKEYKKQWYEDNRERLLEKRAQYYQDNKELHKERCKKYRKTLQGQITEFNSHCKRRFKEENQGSGITKEQWFECMTFFNFKCAYSGTQLNKDNRSIDHIVPLNLGGAHEIWNVVPMYISYNISKLDRNMLQWYKKKDFFSEERLQKIYEWQEYAFNKWHKEEII